MLGAFLWHSLGPYQFVLQLSFAVFSLAISVCGCIVAERVLSRNNLLALLFCVTLAFGLSAPTSFSDGASFLGMEGFYNRLIIGALAVLFIQVLPGRQMDHDVSRLSPGHAIEVLLAAILLNILFLVKISGLVLGLMIMLAGWLQPGRPIFRVKWSCAALLIFGALVAIEFTLTGLKLSPIVAEYQLAARSSPTLAG